MPSDPGAPSAMRASTCSILISKRFCRSEVDEVAFMVHVVGNHPSSTAQNTWMLRSASRGKMLLCRLITPDVPSPIVTRPGDTLAVPTAPMTLSPEPQATRVCGDKPNSSATAFRMVPIGSLGDTMGGSARARIPDGSNASTTLLDHAREATSKDPVPEAC